MPVESVKDGKLTFEIINERDVVPRSFGAVEERMGP